MNPQMRARVIADWRGLPERPFPTDSWVPIGSVLEKVVGQLGLSKRLREEEILLAWREVAGDFIAQHSSPQRLVDGVLYVRVLQPTMAYELDRTLRVEILAKLKQRFGRLVRDIRFRIG
jgi:predicted nucleic acid-binding Zn ribbon protein